MTALCPASGNTKIEPQVARVELTRASAGYLGSNILTDISIKMGSGMHILLGPNGAGKTTLFRVLSGVLPVRSGAVAICGEDPHRIPNVRRNIAYLSHRLGLYPALSVRQNLVFWAKASGLKEDTTDDAISRVAELIEVRDLLGKRAGVLSRGQKQRAALARALLLDPEILLLDEPSTGLDPITARRLHETIVALARSGKTILYATHNLDEAARFAATIVFLARGRIVAQGGIDELQALARARRPDLAEVGLLSLFETAAEEGRL